jgi:hypothetical protein
MRVRMFGALLTNCSPVARLYVGLADSAVGQKLQIISYEDVSAKS